MALLDTGSSGRAPPVGDSVGVGVVNEVDDDRDADGTPGDGVGALDPHAVASKVNRATTTAPRVMLIR
ncbi:MAG TPA: hypothetical protein VKQ71_05305 [Acidimicrobiales bacterium]|nr:hypothetical protein [Acidimicrobiales bacterium]